ncbi:MAG: carbohydrate kinase family protein [Candidatus Kerfeldbacteria bacterium CG15_BIG_FIL_POST_REV_8_21_14_020_45_12]|uniref:Carbohydrate kinase family protein n=1 Tax=Candidatus Kerfeldbacteria bacterium CG15_BIG_FIL_POST_REV_8_21_14_020_45_12 TaxID=2014247 RepID=A0A2M7H5C5_9BACT|nr:MAG: carbohydrate kinase family protein [Candidatus Kerfeldbacteria bacterium CG15_BIG_FIL_POST_REV_8_21_14_020_45_12]PJA93513.1 MAG: carbohydrate kinase family protein [Candidatus Kerfeldbacteria bacterium CG_4_9_14_3_um_filter_45_8]
MADTPVKIYVHGSLAFDRIMDFPGYFKDCILPDKIHDLSVSFTVESVNELRGGSGGNIAYNLSLLNEQPYIINGVGTDAESYLTFLRERNIPTDHIEIHSEVATSSASIITDRSNNQITGFSIGASGKPTTFSFHNVDADASIAIFCPASNTSDSMKLINECKELKIRYIFEPAQTINDFTGDQLKAAISGAEMFTVNDYELELAQRITGWDEARILEETNVLVVTVGEKGSEMRTDEKIVKIPAANNHELKDPTGAGDAYRAGLLVGMARGLRLKHQGRLGAVAASFAVEHIGTQEHVYSIDDFRTRYQESFEADCPI